MKRLITLRCTAMLCAAGLLAAPYGLAHAMTPEQEAAACYANKDPKFDTLGCLQKANEKSHERASGIPQGPASSPVPVKKK